MGVPPLFVLHIEHDVPDYDRWQAAFDSDPVGRQKAGVLRHRVLRATDDPNHVLIDLEFSTAAEAEALLAGLRKLWGQIEGTIITGPVARIASVVEETAY